MEEGPPVRMSHTEDALEIQTDLGPIFAQLGHWHLGLLCASVEILRRLYEPDGMGSRNPWQSKRMLFMFAVTHAHKLTDRQQTAWEGGVYKLIMIFPEGMLALIKRPRCSMLIFVARRLSHKTTEM